MPNYANASRAEAQAGSQKVAGYTIDNTVLHGIRQASRATGVDFGYLMAQAAQESSFQPDVKASTSSATGLYQFLDSTWLGMVKSHGAQHGLQAQADQIKSDGRGGFTVADPKVRKEILDLRKDPKTAAVIGAEFALSNKDELERALGHQVGSTELYFAHFLGAGGATRFLKAIERNSNQSAAALFPDAADANRGVFYDGSGRARTVGDIYQMFSRSIESKKDKFAELEAGPVGAAAAPRPGPRVANLGRAPSTTSVAFGAASGRVDGRSNPMLSSLGVPRGVSLMTMLSLASLDILRNPSGDQPDQKSTSTRLLGMRAYRSI